ncbi:methyltransferase domain-containing protein [Mesoterricola silvestris]|uniref:Trans-aconitate 2-methyltransferase n=1 Tax=Mesoterricola silvestris TaxID=2927979 RepID=A0AA48H3L1_9BACT|nr:methyltransferase domain-containing protein [Mesoterricola silvestris]BDU71283.1 trans-aconitate 2-methyltransferase [Mesoterricola silvestris]
MWNPDAYLRFEQERTRPSRDLCARIPAAAPATVLDTGCGPGNSTQVLRERWPGARITGLDKAPEMIEAARKRHPGGHWVVGDLATFEGGPFDVIFSNAVLQWLPDHHRLLPRLMDRVAAGGFLAVQMPTGKDSPARLAMEKAAAHPRFGGRLPSEESTLTFKDPRFYYETLAPLASGVDLWETTYHHVLPGPEAVVQWFETTGMRPYLERLDPGDQAFFKDRVLEGVREAFPLCADGSLLLPFRRLFFVVQK